MKKEKSSSNIRIYILCIIIILGLMVSPDSFCGESKEEKALKATQKEIALSIKERKKIESEIKAESNNKKRP